MKTPSQTVEILFVDDEKDNLSVLKPRLLRTFLKYGCEASIVFDDNVDDACDRISQRDPSKPFPVVIADLLFPTRPGDQDPNPPLEARGIEVVEQARAASADTVIVALTQGSVHQPGLEQQATERGADIVLLRRQLLANANQGGPQELVRKVHRLLCERDMVAFGPTLVIPEEPGMQAIVHDAGPATLRLLLADIFAERDQEPFDVALDYVTPGASGARVMRAAAKLADGSRRHLFLKISKDVDALREEQRNFDLSAGLYAPPLVVPCIGVVGPRNGWAALGMPCADEALPLRRWITDPTVATEVPRVMDRLFLGGGLSNGYRDGVGSDGERPIEHLKLPAFRRVLVRDAVDYLKPALSHPAGAGAVLDRPEAIIAVVERFSRIGMLGDVPPSDTPGGLLLCMGHGDLHGGNVLVSARDAQPLLVDLAQFGRHHWAADVARLAVDLLLRGLDAGVESFFWRRFADWRRTAARLGELDPSIADTEEQNAAVIAAFRWFAEHKYEILPPLAQEHRPWEWHVALAEQLLRRTYQRDLPPAKRALALVAAHDQILTAASTLPRRSTF